MKGGTAAETWEHPGPLRERLAHPCDAAPVEDLRQRWFQTDVCLEVGPPTPSLAPSLTPPRPPHAPALADDARAPNWIRGALGNALLDTASAEARDGRPCPWSPPCALDVLWGETGMVRRGVAIPRPFVLRLDTAPGEPPAPRGLRVTLSLFGFATHWAEAAAEALVRALRQGIGPAPDGPRLPLPPRWRVLHTPDPPPVPQPALTGPGEAAIGLQVRTPLVLRRKSTPVLDALALLTSLSRRAEGLARWHDTHLLVDGNALAQAAAALTLTVDDQAPPAAWTRTSARQPGRRIPASGVVGRLTLRGPAEALAVAAPLLALGSRFGAGGHAAQGQGRFDLIPQSASLYDASHQAPHQAPA